MGVRLDDSQAMRASRRSMLAALCALSVVQRAGAQAAAIRFGILPIGGALDSRNDWEPLLADLTKALGQSVSLFSATSYEGLDQAMRRGMVDMAFLSGKMALDAVTQHGMRVVAQVHRHDGLTGYRATLLGRQGAEPKSLHEVLKQAGRWRLARGDKRSVSGFIVPQLQLFAPAGLVMETHFLSEQVGTHQHAALALANGEVDVAVNNTADFERFAQQFPQEAARLHVLWSSDLIPHAQIVMRASYPPELVQQVQRFFRDYAKTDGPQGERQRTVLKALHNFAGFRAADNTSLLPAAKLDHELARQTALNASFVNEQARRQRLERLDRAHAQLQSQLRGDAVSH